MPYIQKNGKQFGLADISITTGVQCREMTQAQYDALSTEEKNNGTVYFIVGGKQDNLYISDTVPIGAIQAYGGSSAPAGWLMCNGMAVNRTVYKELFAIIGTTYGEGDTVTTFNLPNLNGRVAVGAGTGYVLGAEGGEASHTLIANEMPSHRHWVSAGTYDDGNGSTTGVSNTQDNGLFADAGTYSESDTCKTYGRYDAWAGGSNGASGKGASQGTTSAHNNMQPYVVTNYIIKAKDTYQVGSSGGDSGGGGSVTIDSTAIPSPNMVAEFDDSAKMNSTDMSSQEITNFVNTIDAQGVNLADHVVEQGVEGIWTWRKWNSGIAECWGTYAKSVSASSVDNNTYLQFPFTFVASPVTTLGLIAGGADLYGVHLEMGSSNASQLRLTMINKHTAAASLSVNLFAIGRWK